MGSTNNEHAETPNYIQITLELDLENEEKKFLFHSVKFV